jgi:hypothetical protein
MHTFALCFLFGSLGAIVGFFIANWARKLPPHMVDHEYCDQRYVTMHRRLSHQIHDQEAEIQRLIQGLS